MGAHLRLSKELRGLSAYQRKLAIEGRSSRQLVALAEKPVAAASTEPAKTRVPVKMEAFFDPMRRFHEGTQSVETEGFEDRMFFNLGDGSRRVPAYRNTNI